MEMEQAAIAAITRNHRSLVTVIFLKALVAVVGLLVARRTGQSTWFVILIIDVVLSLSVVRALAVLLKSIGDSTVLVIAACIGLFVPILGLLELLLANGRATRTLRAAGLKVGLTGVDPNDLDSGDE